MPRGQRLSWYARVKDSKLLSSAQREELSPLIQQSALAVGTGVVESHQIDQLGMTAAVHLAMRLAVKQLHPQPDFLLIDYLTVPSLKIAQKGVENGDTLCFSISCASIVAKVYRDRLMYDLDRRYPGYGLARHKGYGTAEHVACLRKMGPSPIHRRLFQPVKNLAQLTLDDWMKRSKGTDTNGT
jgi:ribonuclease HII